jgi:hypothetical protein
VVATAAGASAGAREPTVHGRPASGAPEIAGLAPLPAPAFRIGKPVPLSSGRFRSRWSAVRRTVVARARPTRDARTVATLRARTPEGTTNIVTPLARAQDRGGALWIRVRLPVLPNGTTGWVPRGALGAMGTVPTRLVVDRRRLTVTLLREGRPVFRAPAGLGASDAPTPAGAFLVRNRLSRYRSPVYGPVAFGTSARSPSRTDWPGGGFVGIHGTDRPQLVPGRVSNGCIRLRNADVLTLARLMPVGTPLTIR